MESKTTNLYKLYQKGWSTVAYVAADCQQEAIDKLDSDPDGQLKAKYSVEYISEVYV